MTKPPPRSGDGSINFELLGGGLGPEHRAEGRTSQYPLHEPRADARSLVLFHDGKDGRFHR
jgi:hypothetical protein